MALPLPSSFLEYMSRRRDRESIRIPVTEAETSVAEKQKTEGVCVEKES